MRRMNTPNEQYNNKDIDVEELLDGLVLLFMKRK
jgi:hypothetical protein